MKEEVQEKLITKVAEISGVDTSEIKASTNVKKELKITSLEMSKIISEFEEEYDAYIKYTELMHCETIEQLAEAIAKSVE